MDLRGYCGGLGLRVEVCVHGSRVWDLLFGCEDNGSPTEQRNASQPIDSCRCWRGSHVEVYPINPYTRQDTLLARLNAREADLGYGRFQLSHVAVSQA